MKSLQIPQNLYPKIFTNTKKFYLHENAVNLSKFTFWKTQRKYVKQTTAIEIVIEKYYHVKIEASRTFAFSRK